MLLGGKPLPDTIFSFKTPVREREIADHPSLKPQHLLRIFVRALLPLGTGVILDPFMGSGSTVAAAVCLGINAIGIELDPKFYMLAERAIPQLAALYPGMLGETLDSTETPASLPADQEQLLLLEPRGRYCA
jgi:site-specific DNA-methyltransferase (adenine-specific)